MNKKIICIILIISVLIIGLVIYKEINKADLIEEADIVVQEEKNKIENENKQVEKNDNKIFVHIAGEVQNPGVFEIEEGRRINDLIQLAGGLTENADISKINLVYVLEDGMKISIPNKNESNIVDEDDTEKYVDKENGKDNTKTQKVNINKATQSELENLPGIGPSIATKIIDYRNSNGSFSNIEDLKKVSGIGENKFNKLKDYVCVK